MQAAATFCATLVDEWIAAGVRHVVLSPGSRSTPMAVAVAGRPELTVHVVHDERSAAFIALGLASVTEPAPPLLLCTSGTAAVNFHPAVVEASMSELPLIVLTADRPGELRGVGAPQTIDQLNLFGSSVRWFHDADVPDERAAANWRPLARRTLALASRGPVHLNLPFREPLLGEPGTLPGVLTDGDEMRPDDETNGEPGAAPEPSDESDGAALALLGSRRGLIMAGGRSGVHPDEVSALARHLGWPVVADPLSGARHLDGVVTMTDAILRYAPFATAQRPDVVVRLGRPPASRVVSEWLRDGGVPIVQIGGPGVIDPEHLVCAVIGVEQALRSTPADPDTAWRDAWAGAEEAARTAVDGMFASAHVLTEPLVARMVGDATTHDDLVVASSMPIRDLEWFGGPGAHAWANRGANGIDGTISTAIGRALAGRAVTALMGDLAFLHDSSALIAVRERRVRLRIVVIDNDGGGIFSFLPQAAALDGVQFEQLFGTPHGTDLVQLCRAHGVSAQTVSTPEQLTAALATTDPASVAPGGSSVSVLVVPSRRNANVEHHRELTAAVTAALSAQRH